MTVKQLIRALLREDLALEVAIEDRDGRVVMAVGGIRVGLADLRPPTAPGEEPPGRRAVIIA